MQSLHKTLKFYFINFEQVLHTEELLVIRNYIDKRWPKGFK